MTPVDWSDKAIDDLRHYGQFIAQSNPLNAIRYVESLFDRVETVLQTFPESGKSLAEIPIPNARELVIDTSRIFYHYADNSVTILTVRNSSEQLSTNVLLAYLK